MLTQDQKDKLEPLTRHEKYGKLLQEAIKGWEKVNPAKKRYGIYHKVSKFELDVENPFVTGCCLLGAAMLLKNSDTDYVLDSVLKTFPEISDDEACELMSGFDADDPLYRTEAFNFGLEVSKILFT